MLILSKDDIKNSITLKDARDMAKLAFKELALNSAIVPQRLHKDFNKSTTGLFMPSYSSSLDVICVKNVTICKENRAKNLPYINATITLTSSKTGEALSLMDGVSITALRTASSSGYATTLIAPKDSKVLAIFGCGTQARSHIDAMCDIFSFETIYIYYNSSKESAKKLKEEYSSKNIVLTKDISLLKHADIICTTTNSTTPLFKKSDVKSRVHINSVGSYTKDMQELDCSLFSNSLVVVDSLSSCLIESGDIINPIKENYISKESIYSLSNISHIEKLESRESVNDGITIFKSVGNGIQDLTLANLVYEKAKDKSLGIEVNI